MRFLFTDEQLAMQAGLRALLARSCPASLVRAAWGDAEARLALWSELAEAGLFATLFPAEPAGPGLGLDFVTLALLLEELGHAGAPGPLVEMTAVAPPILSALHGERGGEALGPMVSGEVVVSAGIGEAVPDADVAHLVFRSRGDSLLMAWPTEAGARLTRIACVDGARRVFEVDVAPEAETLVAQGEAGRSMIAAARDRGALGTAAVLVGLARRMIDMTVEHVKTRTQFGQPIGAFQAVKHHLANARIALEFARPLVYRAAWSVAHERPRRSIDVSMAKAQASDAALQAARVALQCHGAIGYSFEYDLHLFMKRAWALAPAYGDARFHRDRVARHLIDQPAQPED